MSEDAFKAVVNKKRRGNRGGREKHKPDEEQSLINEVIELLSAEGFTIIPPQRSESVAGPKSKANLPRANKAPFKAGSELLGWKENLKKKNSKENSTAKTEVTNKKFLKNCNVSEKNAGSGADSDVLPRNVNGQKKNDKIEVPAWKEEEKRTEPTKKKAKKALKKESEKKVEKKEPISRNNEGETLDSKKSKSTKESKESWHFPKYIRRRDMLKILEDEDPENPTYVKGNIRINPKNFCDAYLSIDNGRDILISGSRNRNKALDQDVVAAVINPKEEWSTFEDGSVQKTGTVVCILEKVHSRKVVGTLALHDDRIKLRSRDQRVPTLVIDPKSVPKKVRASPEAHVNTLFLANIYAWFTPFDCRGSIESIIGEVGDLEGETRAILLANGLDVTPYDEELMDGLPGSDYVLSATDLADREDWRDECVFTIDPATAVDLDDAVSCKKLPNGNYEIGVHISDVTHYLKALSPLDEKVSLRATTVYLVNTVYHMLPKPLCRLCSLLPGEDKLSFSVVWEITPEAEVRKHRFTKSVIKSCYQMSYEDAQSMIEEPTRQWTEADLPNLRGKFTANHICEIVNDLYKLSSKMREKRFANGALSIDQPKLQILLDKETGFPVSYRIEERRESNKLIEEFMLLANMTVAEHLYETMPDTAFLRIHGEPLDRILSRTTEDLGYLGVHLDTESAAGLQRSLALYEKTGLEGFDEEFATNCRMMVINTLCAQSMPRAKYTCSGMITDREDLRHYALNVQFYTHFTSPIRRYADCVVHRLLFSSITGSPTPTGWSAELCATIAANCNKQKYSAKVAQEKSNELYFTDLLGRKGRTETMAIVMKLKKRNMDVILCHVGITIRLRHSDLAQKADVRYSEEHSVSTIAVKWKDTGDLQIINVFSMIHLQIEKNPKDFSIRGVLLPTRLNESPTDS